MVEIAESVFWISGQVNALTEEQVNEYIHVVIMGKCWHIWTEGKPKKVYFGRDETSVPTYACKCGETTGVLVPDNPNYCSEDSPRKLLNEVLDKVQERKNSLVFAGRELNLPYPSSRNTVNVAKRLIQEWANLDALEKVRAYDKIFV